MGNRNMSAPKVTRIAIVGGSIAGCAAAVELARSGFEVTVFERSGEELKDRGVGIGVPRSVIETFVARDLLDASLPFFPARSFVRRWRTPAEPRYGYLAWEQPNTFALLNWGMLYNGLRTRVPVGCYRTEQTVIAVGGDDSHATLTLSDGTTHDFDLVVCADGYASLGRRSLFPTTTIQYAGYVLWRGALPETALIDSTPLESGIHSLGYPGGHGIFYFVPAAAGAVGRGQRMVNWGMYVPVHQPALRDFLTDKKGRPREGSLSPGTMPLATERELKDAAHRRLPSYYADLVEASIDTFVYAIYDCEVPAYRRGRICLIGDAGAFARPHSGAGAFKGMHDATSLAQALHTHPTIDAGLAAWNIERTAQGNELVRFGNQLGRALVEEIPDWSTMDAASMERWFTSIVTAKNEIFAPPAARA